MFIKSMLGMLFVQVPTMIMSREVGSVQALWRGGF